MSLGSEALKLAVDAAASAAMAAIKDAVSEEHYAQVLDETAERLKFDANGQRKLDARRRQGRA